MKNLTTFIFALPFIFTGVAAHANPTTWSCHSYGSCEGSGYDFDLGSYQFETDGYRTEIRTFDNTYVCRGSYNPTCEARW